MSALLLYPPSASRSISDAGQPEMQGFSSTQGPSRFRLPGSGQGARFLGTMGHFQFFRMLLSLGSLRARGCSAVPRNRHHRKQ